MLGNKRAYHTRDFALLIKIERDRNLEETWDGSKLFNGEELPMLCFWICLSKGLAWILFLHMFLPDCTNPDLDVHLSQKQHSDSNLASFLSFPEIPGLGSPCWWPHAPYGRLLLLLQAPCSCRDWGKEREKVREIKGLFRGFCFLGIPQQPVNKVQPFILYS